MKDVSQSLQATGLVSVQASLSADGRKSAARLTVIDQLLPGDPAPVSGCRG